MARESFRRQLRQEAEQWVQDNLIPMETFRQLSDRYEFEQLDRSGQLFTTILYCVGGILVGLGVITFVAANWQFLDKIQKIILLLSWLISINSLGFFLWQRASLTRLGQGLLLIGNLSLGAVIALVAQIFNLSGETYGLFLIWSVGVITMGGFLRFQTLSMLGLILMGIGYLNFIVSFNREFNLIANGMPYLSIVLITLAYWLESRAVFILIALLWMISLIDLTWEINRVFSYVLPITILWGYGDSLKLDRFGSYLSPQRMAPIGKTLSLILSAFALYGFSFRGSWDYTSENIEDPIGQLYFGIMCGISLYVVISQFFRGENITKIYLGIVSLFTVIGLLNLDPVFNIFITNCLLALLSIGLIRLGIEEAKRPKFWLGIILLCLQIMSRLFEYDTDLLVKAFTFALCGLAILGLGIWFERYLNQLSTETNP